MSGVLALDIATRTGWAWMANADAKPEWGFVQAKPSGRAMTTEQKGAVNGLVGRAFFMKFEVLFNAFEPDVVLFEQPIMPSTRKTKIDTLRRLYGLAFMVETLSAARTIRCFDINRSTVLKETVGAGNAKYPAIFRHLRRLGFDVGKDEDAAMAMLLLEFGLRYKLNRNSPRLWRFGDVPNGKDDAVAAETK